MSKGGSRNPSVNPSPVPSPQMSDHRRRPLPQVSYGPILGVPAAPASSQPTSPRGSIVSASQASYPPPQLYTPDDSSTGSRSQRGSIVVTGPRPLMPSGSSDVDSTGGSSNGSYFRTERETGAPRFTAPQVEFPQAGNPYGTPPPLGSNSRPGSQPSSQPPSQPPSPGPRRQQQNIQPPSGADAYYHKSQATVAQQQHQLLGPSMPQMSAYNSQSDLQYGPPAHLSATNSQSDLRYAAPPPMSASSSHTDLRYGNPPRLGVSGPDSAQGNPQRRGQHMNSQETMYAPSDYPQAAVPPLSTHQQQQEIAVSFQPEPAEAGLRSRYMTVRRRVPLKTGNFVVDFPVSQKYLDLCAEREQAEFTHVRYTAVTCDPDIYGKPEAGYDLRPRLYQRDTELFIVMTMYNEDEELFAKTMTSVQKNIAFLCSEKCPVTWGPNGWRSVVVCIVSDGRTKIHKRVLTMLQTMGVYAPGLERTEVEGNKVTAHLYEFTTQVAVDKDLNVRTHKDGIVPVQVLFCLKEKNAKKINSHRWFFNAFGPILKPNVCVLLDVGTKPTSTSIFHLWRAFDDDPQVGGACGEIAAELGKGCSALLNPLVAAQNFEYKMSNILDKPLESVFGYIQVLPGAFSAYRYAALQNSSLTTGPLASYFHGETHAGGETDVFKANMYLAEDRILCFELVTKRNENWILKYVKDAKAETDVPSNLPELVSQRRRWLNGSFFAAVHSVTNYNLIFRSAHSTPRKVIFTIQEVYNIFNLIFSWFAIGNFYLTFHFLFQGTRNRATDPFNGAGYTIFEVLRYLYFASLATLFIISFGNRPQGSKTLYYAILTLMAIIMAFLLFMGGYTVYQGVPKSAAEWAAIGDLLLNSPPFRDIVISLGSTYGLYLLSSLLHLDPWHVVTSMLQYMLLLPVYINVFMVYAFCNLHDISWGTKGDNVASTAAAPAVTAAPTSSADQPAVTVDLPQDDMDTLNAQYEQNLQSLFKRPEKTYSGRDRQTKIDDYFRLYRTRVVLTWMLSNGLLIVIFTTNAITDKLYANIQDKGRGSVNPYLTFIFWSVTVLSVVRFVGSTIYLGTWLMGGVGGAVGGKKIFVPRSEAMRERGGRTPRKGGESALQ